MVQRFFRDMDACRNVVRVVLGEYAWDFTSEQIHAICVYSFTWNEYFKAYEWSVDEAQFWNQVAWVAAMV